MVVAENSGQRRKSGQSLGDRLREIKGEEGWVDVKDLLREKLGKCEQGVR